jgi:hypothetical protein
MKVSCGHFTYPLLSPFNFYIRKPLFQVFSGKRRKHAITTNVEYRSSGAIQNKHTPSTSLKKQEFGYSATQGKSGIGSIYHV